MQADAGDNASEFFKARNNKNVNKLKSEIDVQKDVVRIPALRLHHNQPNECQSHRLEDAVRSRRMTLF